MVETGGGGGLILRGGGAVLIGPGAFLGRGAVTNEGTSKSRPRTERRDEFMAKPAITRNIENARSPRFISGRQESLSGIKGWWAGPDLNWGPSPSPASECQSLTGRSLTS
jgi:hypothetical protein